jgi:hypothetical protein
MSPDLIVIRSVSLQDTAPVRLAEHDEVVERFATDRSDGPLDVAVLPRRAWCGRVISDPVAPQNLLRRAHGFSAGATAMPELHAARFVSEERHQESYLAFSLNRQVLRRLDTLRASRCRGAERIAD